MKIMRVYFVNGQDFEFYKDFEWQSVADLKEQVDRYMSEYPWVMFERQESVT